MAVIHPTAIVDAGAELADDVDIGAYSLIGAKVRIGAGTRIGQRRRSGGVGPPEGIRVAIKDNYFNPSSMITPNSASSQAIAIVHVGSCIRSGFYMCSLMSIY